MSPTPMRALFRRPWIASTGLLMVLVFAGALWMDHAARAGAAMPSGAPDGLIDDDPGGVPILLDLARTAVQEQRVLAPAGSNAYEFYFSVLELDPGNAVARQGQQALFRAATEQLEQAINQGRLNEAQRELALLREYDADNFKVSLLAGKLDAQRQLVIRADEARAAVIQARAAAQPASR